MAKNVKQYKETSESRRSHHTYLTRPDGSLLSEKDCLIFDLFMHFTKGGKVATSTYEWLLKEKFPRQNHPITVNRTCKNLSNYFKIQFKQKQVIDGKVHFHKLRIERVADFDLKIAEAKQLFLNGKCRQLSTEMSIATNINVDSSPPPTPEATKVPEPPIKITIKNTINDNHDYQHNQSQIYKNFSSEFVETEEAKIETDEITANSENGLAKEECNDTSHHHTEPVEQIETSIASDYVLGSTIETVETVGKDGNTYQSPYLRDFRFTDRMLQTAISRSNKPHYTTGKVRAILEYVLEKKPNLQIYGGRGGFTKYLVKMINGEKDYEYEYKYPPTQVEKALSMAEIQAEKQKAIDERYQMLLRGEVQSLSGAENYYG